MTSPTDVAIVGAGPYGLSLSAYLSDRGIEHRIFGPPMQTWCSMPKGMMLKSLDFATSIYAPRRGYSLIDYCRARGLSHAEPLSMELFSTYGLWAQKTLVPRLEPVEVAHLSRPGALFEIGLASGERLRARRVVVATGLAYFAQVPPVLANLPRELVTHTSQNREYDHLRGKEVVVVGGGQSALEAAVMLHEAGARPELVTRCTGASFAPRPPARRPLRHHVLHPMSVLGASRVGFFLQHVPYGLHVLPDAKRVDLTRRLYGPWGAWWLSDRFAAAGIKQTRNTNIRTATPQCGRLELELWNSATGTVRTAIVDHVVAGTGYEPDLDVLPFLDRSLSARIRRIERSPKLNVHFESSVPGLYFVGAAAAFSFGPLLRFVAGAEFAGPAVARHLSRRAVRKAFESWARVPAAAG